MKPTKIGLMSENVEQVLGFVTPDGNNWEVHITDKNGNNHIRYYSTCQHMHHNGSLTVYKKVRDEFGITGIYQIEL